jgi:hypothetical protein
MVRSLDLPERVRLKYAAHMKVGSLYREKQIEAVEKLGFLTNPIDIMRTVYEAERIIVRYFGEEREKLEFKELTVLMLSLLAVNPPANAVSIALFVQDWDALKMVPIVGKAAEVFIAAVNYIFTQEALCVEEEDTEERQEQSDEEEEEQ